jgi:lysophospholipase L1-like esterase
MWGSGPLFEWPTRTLSAQAGSHEVFLKLDFDTGDNPFRPSDSSRATLVDDPEQALAGRSLRIERSAADGYFGAGVPLQITGASDLKIAFVGRANALQAIAVNVFDERRRDNTTPMSPARIFDGEWHPAVFSVEGFRYNGGEVDRRIDLDAEFSGLLFYGPENGPGAELWIDKVVIYRGHDARPPEAPDPVRALVGSDGAIDVTWEEPPDDTFAVVYSVYRKSDEGAWEKIAESLQPAYRDHPQMPATYAYRVTAADFENNVSPPSIAVTATLATAGSPPAARTPASPSVQASDRANYAENVRRVHARGAGTVGPDVFLFAGDSITAATVYTHVLGSWLARGLTVRQGVGTVTTDYGAANIKRYLPDARPEFVVVMYGTNDQERGASISGSMRNLAAIVDACLEFGSIPVLATIPPRGYNKRNQQGQERYNRAVAELGRQKRVPVSYVFEEMMQEDLKAMLYDGVHLHPVAGNETAGRALRRTMDEVYFALRDTSGQW